MEISLSDVRVRVPIAELVRLHLQHVYSEMDQVPDGGYTEWTIAYTRALTFGWDWSFDASTGRLAANWPQLRTNLMLTDAAGQDLGPEQTTLCVAQLATQHRWEGIVAEEIGLSLKQPLAN